MVLIAGKNSDDVYWVVDEDHIAEIIRDTEIHKEKVTRLFRLWSKKVEKFYEFCNSLKVDSSDFISKFPAFLGLYLEEYGIAMLADHYAVGGDIIFEKIARKYPDAVEHAKCLIKPDRLTFLMKEELGFLEILNKWKKEIKSVSNYDSCSPKLKTEINNHQKKYFWIENGYKYVKVLKPEYFFERLKKLGNFKKRLSELRDYGKDTRRRKKLAEKSFNKNDVSLLRQLGLVGWWHDQRKRANLIGLHYHHLFIQKMAEKIGENPETLGYLSAVEFKKLILRRKIDFKDIKKRKNGFAYVLLKGSSEWVGVGEEYKFVQKALLGQSVKKAETLNGLCASPGFAKGKARIILNPHSEKLNEGEILVT
ncbi:MAG TPA: hypothetical protein VJI46_00045, partial [Candidatus Nanoarchaeia archaeon]|nr:hypothetical protein [Candidatus Nanoarchaeia archaeon]